MDHYRRRGLMNRGDVILRPVGNGMIMEKMAKVQWCGLTDLTYLCSQSIPVNFAEHYDQDRYPSSQVQVSASRCPQWADVQKYLDNAKGDYATYTYESQVQKGQPLSTIIGGQAERIAVGATSPLHQETVRSFTMYMKVRHAL